MGQSETPIQQVTIRIQEAIRDRMANLTHEKFWVTYYGANNIDPKHLVYWIVVQSDREKWRLAFDTAVDRELRALLDLHEYPIEGRAGVHIGFESHETVNRESDGKFWLHWK